MHVEDTARMRIESATNGRARSGRWRALAYGVALAVSVSGCKPYWLSFAGYFPESVSADHSRPACYGEVRAWAVTVADGYDSRHTLNRYALYGGGITAGAGAGAMAGLAAFSAGHPALIGIPIGATFLATMLGLYQNDKKSLIYDAGSRAIEELIVASDCRMKAAACATSDWSNQRQICRPELCRSVEQQRQLTDEERQAAEQECRAAEQCRETSCLVHESPAQSREAACLLRDVNVVMRNVSEHVMLLDPKNVVDQLKGLAAKVEKEKAELAKKKAEQDATKNEAATAPTDAQAAKLEEKVTALEKQIKAQEAKVDEAVAKLSAAAVSAGGDDMSDLQVVTTACPVTESCLAQCPLVNDSTTTTVATATSIPSTSVPPTTLPPS